MAKQIFPQKKTLKMTKNCAKVLLTVGTLPFPRWRAQKKFPILKTPLVSILWAHSKVLSYFSLIHLQTGLSIKGCALSAHFPLSLPMVRAGLTVFLHRAIFGKTHADHWQRRRKLAIMIQAPTLFQPDDAQARAVAWQYIKNLQNLPELPP